MIQSFIPTASPGSFWSYIIIILEDIKGSAIASPIDQKLVLMITPRGFMFDGRIKKPTKTRKEDTMSIDVWLILDLILRNIIEDITTTKVLVAFIIAASS